MAIELGLNRYSRRHDKENPMQRLERRNRERTYLVLWVHDRSLSMQTGRQWMLPEVRSSPIQLFAIRPLLTGSAHSSRLSMAFS
jgi:hypothetical protein